MFCEFGDVENIKSRLLGGMQALGRQVTTNEPSALSTLMGTTLLVSHKSAAANTESKGADCSTSKGGLWQELTHVYWLFRGIAKANTDAYVEMRRYVE